MDFEQLQQVRLTWQESSDRVSKFGRLLTRQEVLIIEKRCSGRRLGIYAVSDKYDGDDVGMFVCVRSPWYGDIVYGSGSR